MPSEEITGFLRVATIAPELRVSDVSFNAAAITRALHRAAKAGASLALFPELCLTGYTFGDLFAQTLLLMRAREGLLEVAGLSKTTRLPAVVALPLAGSGRLCNCAAVIGSGRVLGLVPKQFRPTSGEYYEERWFTAASNL